MNNIFEKISVTLILLKIFGIYFFCYLATNEKIAITHLWHAIEPQTMYHPLSLAIRWYFKVREIFSNMLSIYFLVSYHIVKFQTC